MSSKHINKAAVAVLAALAAPVSAFWRLPCGGPLVTERADPLISPGKVSGHVHTIMGGNGFGFEMDYNDTQEATCSTCLVTTDFSNYWVPTLYYQAENGSFISVSQSGGATVYYLQRSSEDDPEYDEGLLAFPEGFRMVAGDPTLRNYTDTVEQQAISFACLGTDNAETNYIPDYNCPDGLRAQVFFPSCWNGVDLDSDDHKSHMSYPSVYNAGTCPDDYPKRFISLFYEVIWSIDEFSDMWYGDSHPFVFSTGDPTGYGYHGDFVNGWDVDTLQQAVDQCTDDSGVVQDCSVFEFFTDDETNACWIPSSVDEQVFGVMDALPGCNPIQPGPGAAVMGQTCAATTTISAPNWGYVDLTTSMGYEYIGCGSDPAGETRTLSSDSVTTDNMTVEYCVSYCDGLGYTYAGVEYSTQCYCGDTVSSDRLPVSGYAGDCTMTCAGDSSEFCGGAAVISLYQKCTGDTCENVSYEVNASIMGDESEDSGSDSSAAATSATSASADGSSTTASTASASASDSATSDSATLSSVSETEKLVATTSTSSSSLSSESSPFTTTSMTTQTVVPVEASSTATGAAASNESSVETASGTGSCSAATVTVTVPVMTLTVRALSDPSSTEALGSKPQSTSISAPYGFGNGTLPIGTAASTGFLTSTLASGTGAPFPTGHGHGHAHNHKL